jgi:hypothetical protein
VIWRNWWKHLYWLLLSLTTTWAIGAQAQVVTIPNTDLVFPPTLAKLSRVDYTNYEPNAPGLGYSVSYKGYGYTLSVYIYQGGEIAIPEDIDDPRVKQQFTFAIRNVVSAYENVTATLEFKKTIGSTSHRAHAIYFRFLTKTGVEEESQLYVSTYKNQYFKIRLTYPQTKNDEAKIVTPLILKEIGDLLREP